MIWTLFYEDILSFLFLQAYHAWLTVLNCYFIIYILIIALNAMGPRFMSIKFSFSLMRFNFIFFFTTHFLKILYHLFNLVYLRILLQFNLCYIVLFLLAFLTLFLFLFLFSFLFLPFLVFSFFTSLRLIKFLLSQ